MKQSGFGIASLICGIVGILLACIAIGIVPAVLGVVFAFIAFLQKNKGHGTAIAGLICSIVGIAAFLLVMFVFTSGDSDNSPKKVSSDQETQIESTESNSTEDDDVDVFTVGDTVETENLIISLTGVSTQDEDDWYEKPSKGNTFYKLDFEFENISDEDQDISAYYFSAYADDYNVDRSGNDLTTTLSPGKKIKGSVYFDAPKKTKKLEVEYKPDYWGNSKVRFEIDF